MYVGPFSKEISCSIVNIFFLFATFSKWQAWWIYFIYKFDKLNLTIKKVVLNKENKE